MKPHDMDDMPTGLPLQIRREMDPVFQSDTESPPGPPPTTVHQGTPEARSWSLGAERVDDTVVNACFARFSAHYEPLLPILSSSPAPIGTYRESVLKFWVIVAIGARRLSEDPTLWLRLSQPVENMALASLSPGQVSPYAVIEALLLMSTWHLSTDKPFYASLYFTISDVIVTLALQTGLHPCWSLSQVFPDRPRSEQDNARGAKLWAYAVVMNQSAMAINGIPAGHYSELRHLLQSKHCCRMVPNTIMMHARVVSAVSKAHCLISELDLEREEGSSDRVLSSLMSALEMELEDIEAQHKPIDGLNKLHVAVAHLQIRSIALLLVQNDSIVTDLTRLFEAALKTVETIDELQETCQILQHCPDYVAQALVLAASTLLKLLKSHPPRIFNTRDGTKALFSTMAMFSADISATSEDVPAKIAQILSGLWSHEHVYREPDGAYIRPLQIRNRLTASVVFDCLHWWRKISRRRRKQQIGEDNTNPSAPPTESGDTSIGSDLVFSDDFWQWGADLGFAGFWNFANEPTPP